MDEAFRLFKSTREYLTPVLTQSAFYDRGMLTPEEFVRAGDHLIRTCPSWRWESGEQSKLRPYLPADKQFLSTRGVPSYSRVSTMQDAKLIEDTVQGGIGEGDSDWCAPALVAPNPDDDLLLVDANDYAGGDEDAAVSAAAKGVEGIAVSKAPATATQPTNSNINDGDDDEYLDMEDESLALDGAITKPNTTTTSNKATAATMEETSTAVKGHPATSSFSGGGELIRTRRYDISMTYDNYYRTPRIWLYGFDENGTPLSPTDIFQDIMQDYAKKTVTIDPHPHLSKPHASIHPCQHGPAMLNIIKSLQEGGSEPPTVEQYLFVFLKFIQSVVPTIEYDYTVDVQVRAAGEKAST